MLPRSLTTISPVILILLLVISYLMTRLDSEDEISRARLEVAWLRAERDSIRRIVAANNAVQGDLRRQVEEEQADAASLRTVVRELEQRRAEGQLTVRRMRKTPELQQRLQHTFPEVAATAWGVTTIPIDDGDTLGLEYLAVPAWFAETFIIDHENAQSWREQKDKLLAVDSLETVVIALQDSISALHEQNALALGAGYTSAMSGYQGLSERYIAELKKPRFSIGSTVGLCIGSAGAGALIATLVRR